MVAFYVRLRAGSATDAAGNTALAAQNQLTLNCEPLAPYPTIAVRLRFRISKILAYYSSASFMSRPPSGNSKPGVFQSWELQLDPLNCNTNNGMFRLKFKSGSADGEDDSVIYDPPKGSSWFRMHHLILCAKRRSSLSKSDSLNKFKLELSQNTHELGT